MSDAEQLLNRKRAEITKVFAAYGDLSIYVNSSSIARAEPDVDILVNLDDPEKQQILVCINNPARFHKPNSPELIDAIDWGSVCLDIIFRLSITLKVLVNVIDKKALRSTYPITFKALNRTL